MSGPVVVDLPKRSEDRVGLEQAVRQLLDRHGDNIAGYAIVVWSDDNASSCDINTRIGNRIPHILVPDFVRARLLAYKIEEWTLDDVKAMLGIKGDEPA